MRRGLLALCLAAGPAFAQAPAIVVGAVLPASGQLADLGEEMRKALVLWQELCSAEGGLLGRAVSTAAQTSSTDRGRVARRVRER